MLPLIINDIEKIIAAIDEWDERKAELSSLFLLGDVTGLRGHSCSAIKYKDFIGLK